MTTPKILTRYVGTTRETIWNRSEIINVAKDISPWFRFLPRHVIVGSPHQIFIAQKYLPSIIKNYSILYSLWNLWNLNTSKWTDVFIDALFITNGITHLTELINQTITKLKRLEFFKEREIADILEHARDQTHSFPLLNFN